MRAMVWRYSAGIGKTVHLTVDWDHGESPPHGRLAVCLVSGAPREALLPSDVNIREDCENGKREVQNQRRQRNAKTRACAHSMMGETNAPGKQASGVEGLRAMQTIRRSVLRVEKRPARNWPSETKNASCRRASRFSVD
jgi:hypothetical protein